MTKYKITKKNVEPRWEITRVGKNYEIYLHPKDAIGTFSKEMVLSFGFTKEQLNYVDKHGTTYFIKAR